MILWQYYHKACNLFSGSSIFFSNSFVTWKNKIKVHLNYYMQDLALRFCWTKEQKKMKIWAASWGIICTLHSHCFSNGFWWTFVGPCHFQWIQWTVRWSSVRVRWNPSEMTKFHCWSRQSPMKVRSSHLEAEMVGLARILCLLDFQRTSTGQRQKQLIFCQVLSPLDFHQTSAGHPMDF